jgi:hypothetical protein
VVVVAQNELDDGAIGDERTTAPVHGDEAEHLVPELHRTAGATRPKEHEDRGRPGSHRAGPWRFGDLWRSFQRSLMSLGPSRLSPASMTKDPGDLPDQATQCKRWVSSPLVSPSVIVVFERQGLETEALSPEASVDASNFWERACNFSMAPIARITNAAVRATVNFLVALRFSKATAVSVIPASTPWRKGPTTSFLRLGAGGVRICAPKR